jgi:hypothetical protein
MSSEGKAPEVFSAAELVMIRHAVEDHAAGWYGQVGPFTFGREQAARYTSEGPLSGLCDRHGLPAVWRAVAEVIEENPQVLEHRLSDEERAQRQQQRAEHAGRLADEAAAAFQAGDQPRALELIDQAELADPTHRPAHRTFDDLRGIIRTKATT